MESLTLSVSDRIYIHLLTPTVGGRVEMILANSILKAVQFTVEEVSKFGLRDNKGGYTTWDRSEDITIEISDQQKSLLLEGIELADQENRILREMMPLIEKIEALN